LIECFENILQNEILCPFLFHKKRTKRKSPCDKSLAVASALLLATLLWVVSQGKRLFDGMIFALAKIDFKYPRDPTHRAAWGAEVQGVTRAFLDCGMLFWYLFSLKRKVQRRFEDF
jgi:hypothetical protein